MTDVEFLEGRGWIKIAAPYHQHWCWRQPKTGALFQLQDAVDTQRGIDIERQARVRQKTLPEIESVPEAKIEGVLPDT